MLDQIDTPAPLAVAIAEAVERLGSGVVFDPTVGNGALLRAVRSVHGGGLVFAGTDIDRGRIESLAAVEPGWRLGVADALNIRSRAASAGWRTAAAGCELIVFNPPFSFRGNGGVRVRIGGEGRTVSPALSFILAASTLAPSRGMVGVVPLGSLYNRRDSEAWGELSKHYEINVVKNLARGSFPGIAATCAVIRLQSRVEIQVLTSLEEPAVRPRELPVVRGCSCVEVFRGAARLFEADRWGGRQAILHTTDLHRLGASREPPIDGRDMGPMVIVPRVGLPDRSKIRVVYGSANLSDCLLALRPVDKALVEEIASGLRDNFDILSMNYQGTGAPHITLGRMRDVLLALGLRPLQRATTATCVCGGAKTWAVA